MEELQVEVSDAVALFNQTLDYAYPSIAIIGELANFRVSRGKWVYFDLKDEYSILRFFGTVFSLPGPLEDGMKLAVKGRPHVHEQYGFSVQVSSITPVGKGAIKKAADLLAKKLEAEGLFSPERKRQLPYPPQSIGLITSIQSAAYADFIKVTAARYGGIEIQVYDAQVQGEQAIADIIAGIKYFNEVALVPEVVVITRGGGSAEDLAAFSNEHVVRAVASSRVPTLLAIGHEIDLSLAELAADARASTPSNAAELLVPDKKELLNNLEVKKNWLEKGIQQHIKALEIQMDSRLEILDDLINIEIKKQSETLTSKLRLLEVLNPTTALRRGYALVRKQGKLVRSAKSLKSTDTLDVQFYDGNVTVRVE